MKKLITILFVLFISGCTNFPEVAETIRDPNLTAGCHVTDAELGFDSYLKTTNGRIEACALKCSPPDTLPKNFTYKYENTRTGCSVEVKN